MHACHENYSLSSNNVRYIHWLIISYNKYVPGTVLRAGEILEGTQQPVSRTSCTRTVLSSNVATNHLWLLSASVVVQNEMFCKCKIHIRIWKQYEEKNAKYFYWFSKNIYYMLKYWYFDTLGLGYYGM